jgi:hypothetical protein
LGELKFGFLIVIVIDIVIVGERPFVYRRLVLVVRVPIS